MLWFVSNYISIQNVTFKLHRAYICCLLCAALCVPPTLFLYVQIGASEDQIILKRSTDDLLFFRFGAKYRMLQIQQHQASVHLRLSDKMGNYLKVN